MRSRVDVVVILAGLLVWVESHTLATSELLPVELIAYAILGRENLRQIET